MPLSQMLLLRVFPKEKATLATVIWAMTTLVGPVAGPILGGIICDNYGWQWIFFIKVPIAACGGLVLLMLMKGQADPKSQAFIDKVGLGLLVVWVGALQIMLDEGRNKDWFASPEIRTLGIVAAISFVAFVIWELTEKNPIVDLKIFRHRGFVGAATTYAIGFGGFFASIVLLPLWLQSNMGYTATWAGYATGIMGILAVLSAPFVGKACEKFDPRFIVCGGVLGLAGVMLWRMWEFNPDVTFLQMAWPTLITGVFMVMFFVPVTGLAMASVDHDEQANAAGLSNFMRTLAGAFATSLVQSGWSNATRRNEGEIVNAMQHGKAAIDGDARSGHSARQRPGAALAGDRRTKRHACDPEHVRDDRDLPRLCRDDHLARTEAEGPHRHQRCALNSPHIKEKVTSNWMAALAALAIVASAAPVSAKIDISRLARGLLHSGR